MIKSHIWPPAFKPGDLLTLLPDYRASGRLGSQSGSFEMGRRGLHENRAGCTVDNLDDSDTIRFVVLDVTVDKKYLDDGDVKVYKLFHLASQVVIISSCDWTDGKFCAKVI